MAGRKYNPEQIKNKFPGLYMHKGMRRHWCPFGCGKKVTWLPASYLENPEKKFYCWQCSKYWTSKEMNEAGNNLR